jgi:hypothetical protein
MVTKLSAEQRAALQAGGCPLIVEDDQTRQVYVLMPQDDYRRLLDEELRGELQIAFDQAAAADEQEWNLDTFLAKARREMVEDRREQSTVA